MEKRENTGRLLKGTKIVEHTGNKIVICSFKNYKETYYNFNRIDVILNVE